MLMLQAIILATELSAIKTSSPLLPTDFPVPSAKKNVAGAAVAFPLAE